MSIAAEVWVAALIRRAQLAGAFATVARRGDARAGSVLVKAYNPRTREAALYAGAWGKDGERMWMQPVDSRIESELDAYVERSRRNDPDLWVVEVEDVEGRHFLTEPVETKG